MKWMLWAKRLGQYFPPPAQYEHGTPYIFIDLEYIDIDNNPEYDTLNKQKCWIILGSLAIVGF